MASKKIKIAIVIVSYNSTSDTIALLRSLIKLPPNHLSLSIVLIDNGTPEKDYQKLASFAHSKNQISIKLIRNEKNVGLSKALNQAVPFCKNSDYIWRLDNDVKVTKSTLNGLIAVAETYPKVGCVGSVAYNYDHHGQLFGGGWRVNWWRGSVVPIPTPKKPVVCDFVSGFSLLFPTTVIKEIGYLSDENYFAYSEDVDICRQVQKLGKKVYLNPNSILYHRQTAVKNLSPFLVNLTIRNRVLMMRKNATKLQMIAFTPYFFTVATVFNLKNILSLPTNMSQKEILIQAYFKGVSDGFLRNFVKPSSV